MMPLRIEGKNSISPRLARAHNRHALSFGYPEIERMEDTHEGAWMVFGSGPSLDQTLSEGWLLPGVKVAAGSSHDTLIERGFTPDAAIIFDPRPHNVKFLKYARPVVKYYVASWCCPEIFEALKGCDVTLWHPEVGIKMPRVAKRMRINGGGSVTLRAWNLGMVLGYRRFDFFGFDACMLDDKRHAMEHGLSDSNILKVFCKGRWFNTTASLAGQAQDWEAVCKKWGHLFTVAVHGDGLISHMTHGKETA